MREMPVLPLYELDEPGKYFDFEVFGNVIVIWCIPRPRNKNQKYTPVRTIIPTNRPYYLNDIFTKLRLRQRVFKQYGR